MSECKIQIIISGGAEFNPASITNLLDVSPDDVWKIGDKIGRSIRERNENAWVLSTRYLENVEVAEMLEKLLDKIKPVEASLINYLDNNRSIEMQVSIVINTTDDMPALNFCPNLIAKMASFNASIDIDVILIE